MNFSKTQQYIAFGVMGFVVILLLVVLGILPGLRQKAPASVSIEVWGIDSEESVRDILGSFKAQFPYITVNYFALNKNKYEETLINRLAENRGPDVFFLKNSQILKHRDKIFPLPQDSLKFSTVTFRNTFVDGPARELISAQNEILGLPLYIDTLGLYYNKDIFNAAGIAELPRSWEEVISDATKLTTKTQAGDIIKSGIALGDAKSVEYAFQILSTLILQNGDPIVDNQGKPLITNLSADAIRFYTAFSDPARLNLWTPRFRNSLDALSDGTTAMAFGFSEDARRLQLKNPHLSLGVIPFPQPKNAATQITYGEYYFPTVSKLSKNPDAAWQFIVFLASADSALRYSQKTGLPPARRDVVSQGTLSGILDTFYRQTLIGRSWLIPDEPLVKGIFGDAIQAASTHVMTPEQAAGRIRDQLQLLTQ